LTIQPSSKKGGRAVKLTQDILDRYKGGQLEIHDPHEGYLGRGEIAHISLDADVVEVVFSWRAELLGYPQSSTHWVSTTELNYTIRLMDYNYSDIGLRRIWLSSRYADQTVTLTFYMPGEPGLHLADVEEHGVVRT
jgi:hypothetical protein